MKTLSKNKSKKTFYATLVGTIFVALCCFTPILVIAFVGVGLGLFVPYLDFVLYPALGILIVLTIIAYRRYRSDQKCCVTDSKK